MGATDPKKAAAGTIRADFAKSIDAKHGARAATRSRTRAVETAYFFRSTEAVLALSDGARLTAVRRAVEARHRDARREAVSREADLQVASPARGHRLRAR